MFKRYPVPVVILLCGASHMGKSYAATQILAAEYGATFAKVDRLYTKAVEDAGMVMAASAHDVKGKNVRDARRRARDRRWPNPQIKDTFFSSLSEQFKEVLQRSRDKRALAVIEGGTLRREDELTLLAQRAHEVFGNDVQLIRVTIEAPYERWLQNRVYRAHRSAVAQIKVSALTRERYEGELKAARPTPNALVQDHVTDSVDDLRALVRRLQSVNAEMAN